MPETLVCSAFDNSLFVGREIFMLSDFSSFSGFWSEDDVTRPFVSQAVIFEGRYFAFFCYQLNTLALTVEADQNNPRRNICWGTESKPLYESIENNDVKGFNDEVLAHFVKFLLNKSKEL